MKRSRLLGAVCACAFELTFSHAVFPSPIVVTGISVVTSAYDLHNTYSTDSSTTIPYSTTVSENVGNSSSTTDINYSGNDSYTTFAYDFTHSIDNTTGDTSTQDYAAISVGNDSLYFTATGASSYTIDGYYTMTGPAGTYTYLNVYLYDLTTSTFLFRDLAQSWNTANESFTVGGDEEADASRISLGSLTGNLIDGHDYRFLFSFSISAYAGSPISTLVAATADGSLSLSIGAVPVPPAVWLFGSGLLGLLSISRRKKA